MIKYFLYVSELSSVLTVWERIGSLVSIIVVNTCLVIYHVYSVPFLRYSCVVVKIP